MERTLSRCGTAVWQPQDVVIETVFFVPHAVLPDTVHARGNPQEVLDEFIAEVLVRGIVHGHLHAQLDHVLAKQGHPGRAVGLLQIAARGQGGAAIENPDVIEPEEAPFKDIFAEAILAVDPPGEVQHELVKRALEEVDVTRAAQGQLGLVQKEGGPGVDRRVDVAEVPLVGGDLAARVEVDLAQHEIELLLGKIRVHDGKGDGVEGQVPGGIPGILPFVWHRDDVIVHHVEPLAVADLARVAVERVGMVFLEPPVGIEVVVLLAPEHAGQGLSHDTGFVLAERWRRDGLVKGIRFSHSGGKEIIEGLAKGLSRSLPRCA